MIDKIAFSASTILGAKSLAYQSGIDPRRRPDFQAWVGGMWTLVYCRD